MQITIFHGLLELLLQGWMDGWREKLTKYISPYPPTASWNAPSQCTVYDVQEGRRRRSWKKQHGSSLIDTPPPGHPSLRSSSDDDDQGAWNSSRRWSCYVHTVHCTLEVCIVHVNTMLHFIPYKAVATTTNNNNRNSNNSNSGEPGRFEGSFVIIISVLQPPQMICR